MVNDLVHNYTALVSCIYNSKLCVEQSLVAQGVVIAIPKVSKLENHIEDIKRQYLIERYSTKQLASEYKVGLTKLREFFLEHDINARSTGNKEIKKIRKRVINNE